MTRQNDIESNHDATGHHEHRSIADETSPLLDNSVETSKHSPAPISKTNHSVLTIVLVLMMSASVSQLDTSLALTTHPRIASEFGKLSSSSWLITSYALAMAAAQPLAGKLSDVYGRKTVLITSDTIFWLGCICCGTASTFTQVVLGRVVSGIGGAGMSALVAIIISDIVPVRDIGPWRSYINLAGTTFRSLGGPIGGVLADTIGWRWSFLCQVPLLAVASILTFIVVPTRMRITSESKHECLTSIQKLRLIDFTGAFFLVSSILGLMLPLSIAGNQIPWTHPLVFGAGCMSVISFVIFVVVEHHFASNPILPPALMRNKDAVASFGALMFQAAAHIGMMFTIPIHFQVANGSSSSAAGFRMVPAVIGSAFGGIITGYSIKWTGKYKPQIMLGIFLSAVANALLFWLWRGSLDWLQTLCIVPGGLGAGAVGSATYISVTAALDTSLNAIASSTQYLSQSLGQVGGLSAAGAVMRILLEQSLTSSLRGVPGSATIVKRATDDVEYVQHLSGKTKDLVVGAYIDGLKGVHALSVCLNIIAWLLAAFITPQQI